MSQIAKPSHLPRLSDQWLTCRGAAVELGVAQTDKVGNPAHWAAATLQASQSLGAAGAALLCRPHMCSQLQGLISMASLEAEEHVRQQASCSA